MNFNKKGIAIAVAVMAASALYAWGKKDYKDVTPGQFRRLVDSNPDVQILDVRTMEEHNEDCIEGTHYNIDINNPDFLEIALATLDKEKPVAVYCRSGRRSEKAAKILAKQGFKVVNLKGGILAYKQ